MNTPEESKTDLLSEVRHLGHTKRLDFFPSFKETTDQPSKNPWRGPKSATV